MLEMEHIFMPAVSIIGREGSTDDGEGFIARLWEEYRAKYSDVYLGFSDRDTGTNTTLFGAP